MTHATLTGGRRRGRSDHRLISRGPGLPNYTDDKGNWTETLGLVSLVVEGALLVLAADLVARSRRQNA